MFGNFLLVPISPGSVVSHPQAGFWSFGSDGINVCPSSAGSGSQASVTEVPVTSVGPVRSTLGLSHSDGPLVCSSSLPLARPGVAHFVGSDRYSGSLLRDLHRLVPSGVGCSSGFQLFQGVWDSQHRSLHFYFLELLAVKLALQEFQEFLLSPHVLVHSVNATAVAYISEACRRGFQCSGGPPQSRSVSYPDRVDVVFSGPGTSLGSVGQAHDRSVCDVFQQTSPSLCVTSSRFSSLGGRRSVLQLGRSHGLRVPSSSSHSKSP